MKIVYRNYNILILLLVVEAEGRDDLAMTCIIIRYMERQADRRDEQFSSKASKILFLTLNRYVAIKELFMGGEGQAINDRRGNMVIVTNPVNQASFYQQKEKFKKEALRLANLSHPNLVKVHELFEENGTAYFVMDYIDGESLRSKLNREGRLSESLVLKYMQQLLPALETAHRQNIWHLDIKPENIMVDKYYHVYLIDFGASKHIERNKSLTTSLALAYTPGFCPPELLELSHEAPENYIQTLKDIGPWTDIYALGATMYNLLTDSIPPSSNRLYQNGRNAFMFPSNISSSTQDLIIWMMKPNRNERPQRISDIKYRIVNSQPSNDENTIIDKSSTASRGYSSENYSPNISKAGKVYPDSPKMSLGERLFYTMMGGAIGFIMLFPIAFVLQFFIDHETGEQMARIVVPIWVVFWAVLFFFKPSLLNGKKSDDF